MERTPITNAEADTETYLGIDMAAGTYSHSRTPGDGTHTEPKAVISLRASGGGRKCGGEVCCGVRSDAGLTATRNTYQDTECKRIPNPLAYQEAC